MTVSKVTFCEIHSNGNCGICLDPLENESAVAHNWQLKTVHHYHKRCLIVWLKVHAICPECKKPVDLGSLFTWQERTARFLRFARTEVCLGAATHATMSASLQSGAFFIPLSDPLHIKIRNMLVKFFTADGVVSVIDTSNSAISKNIKVLAGAGFLLDAAMNEGTIYERAQRVLVGAGIGFAALGVKYACGNSPLSQKIANLLTVNNDLIPPSLSLLGMNLPEIFLSPSILQTSIARGVLGIFSKNL